MIVDGQMMLYGTGCTAKIRIYKGRFLRYNQTVVVNAPERRGRIIT